MLWKITDMDGNGFVQMEWIVFIGKSFNYLMFFLILSLKYKNLITVYT